MESAISNLSRKKKGAGAVVRWPAIPMFPEDPGASVDGYQPTPFANYDIEGEPRFWLVNRLGG